jgi:hypothetical protein
MNPACTHPESFEHILQLQPKKERTPIVLDDTSVGEEDEREVTQIEKSEEEEYQTGSEEEEKEEDMDKEDSRPKIRKIQPLAVLRTTVVKATLKATPKASIWALASQGRSSQKKARKAK